MKTVLIICTIGLCSILSYAQQFQLETTIDKKIEEIFDIDGDGICEYIADTNKVYDGLTHLLKYSFPGRLDWGDETSANNPYSYFPNIDYNNDDCREVILYDNSDINNGKAYIYDLKNNQILFEFDPPEENGYFQDLVDIDGDGIIEIIFMGETFNFPNPDVYKTYIYSTGLTTSALEENNINSPNKYKLNQNYPNPFNPSTTIRYSLSSPEKVSIKIYDVSGQLVKEINKEHNQSGEYEVRWDGKNDFGQRVSSGTYFYQLIVDNYAEAKKMILLK